MGDVNNDNAVDLADSIIALQVQVGVSTSQPVSLQADVNSDGKIGIEEAIYALQVTTGLKPSAYFFTAAILFLIKIGFVIKCASIGQYTHE